MGHTFEGERTPRGDFFVIVFEGRTGSSYTVSCLNSHPQILCYPEVLAHKDDDTQKNILKGIAHGKALEKLHQTYVNPRYFHTLPTTKTSFQAVGFKTKLHDVHRISHFFDYLHRHHFRLIYLKRRNILKSAISMLNAHRLVGKYGDGHWNASHKDQVQGAFYVPPDVLLAQLQVRIRVEKWHQRFFDLYDGAKLQIFYEDLLQDETRFMFRLLDFLGVESNPLCGRFFKNTPDNLQDAILNYDEIHALFVNTYFEQFFNDGLGE